jgi:formamidopyrimidine-DNA glycosylase
MPELPELEAFVRAQRERLRAEPVAEVPVAHFATLKTVGPPPAALVGRRFAEVRRRAKRLLFETEDAGPVLMLHLMSAGLLAVGPGHPKSSVLAVRFEDDTELAMTEAGRKRRAGAWLLTPEAAAEQLAHIGPEPLDPAFDTAALKAALEQHPHRLHAFLRDQRAIAGTARHANEILHAARLSPYANGASLTPEQQLAAYAAIVGKLSEAPGAAGSAVPEGAGGEGRARLPGARPAGQAVPGVRE